MQGFKLLVAMVIATLLAVAPAHAAFPGENGRIAFFNSGMISTMDPDGSDVVAVTTGVDPMWSPDGARIGFVRGGGLWYVNADGSLPQQIPNAATNLYGPAWSPDGSSVAFNNNPGTGFAHIFRINIDGTGLQKLTGCEPEAPDHGAGHDPVWSPTGARIAYQGEGIVIDDGDENPGNFGGATVLATGCGEQAIGGMTWDAYSSMQLDWSPDGSKLAFSGPPGMNCLPSICQGTGPGEIWIVNADGSGAVNLTNSAAADAEPAWSPDGTKIAFSSQLSGQDREINTMNVDGSGVVQITSNTIDDHLPSWQPVQHPHARPKGATPFRVPLVPAAKPCTSPNREHGPSLAFGSCSPVQPESPNLTISQGDARLRSIGSVRMDVLVGAPGAPDDSDVQIRFSLTNVMNSSDLSDYTGTLTASTGVRRTDRDAGQSSTTQDFALTYSMPCAATADTFLGATCASNTSFDALVPGSAAEGSRAIWALDRLEVFDGGPAGDGDGASLFATQGVFVP